MKRIVTLLAVLALAPLLMGGGGINPGTPANKKITGPAVSATIVMDPHEPGLTFNGTDGSQKGKQASIRIQKGGAVSGATFRIPLTFVFASFGCDLTKMTDRFVITQNKENKLVDWIPQSIIDQIFGGVGITVTPTNVPVITDVDNAVCTADPENLFATPGPGILSFQALIQFLVPK